MLGIPDVAGAAVSGWAFEPPCDEPGYPNVPPTFPHQGHCSGDWMHNLTMYDYLRVPEHLKPGEYVLGFRWDCETSAQVWQSCAGKSNCLLSSTDMFVQMSPLSKTVGSGIIAE